NVFRAASSVRTSSTSCATNLRRYAPMPCGKRSIGSMAEVGARLDRVRQWRALPAPGLHAAAKRALIAAREAYQFSANGYTHTVLREIALVVKLLPPQETQEEDKHEHTEAAQGNDCADLSDLWNAGRGKDDAG